MRTKRSESGQVIFLLLIGMVSLLAFAGLAIDGGRVFSERRTIQNIADTASFTGALRIGQELGAISSAVLDNAKAAAYDRAADNGYPQTGDPDVTVNVTIDTVTEAPYYLVIVDITSKVDPTFIQIVYSGELNTAARAVARVLPKTNVGYGNAMMSLSTECEAIEFSGNSDINVTGSGIYSNSDSACSCGVVSTGNGSAHVEQEITTPAGGPVADGDPTCDTGSGDHTAGDHVYGASPLPILEVPPVDCSLPMPYITVTENPPGSRNYDITPGRWSGANLNNGTRTYNFLPGLYCLSGNLTMNGSTVNGDGVLFYMESGWFIISGGTVNLTAPSGGFEDKSGQDWDGMLVYIAEGNSRTFEVSGNAEVEMVGTIYAPSPSHPTSDPKCYLNGGGDTWSLNLQLICYKIELRGDGTLDINYDGSNHYKPPVEIDLVE